MSGKTDSPPRSAPPDWQAGALQAIFALFLGVIIAIVVGVGVNTFYANPASAQQEQLTELYDEQAQLYGKAEPARGELSPADEARSRQIDAEIAALQRQIEPIERDWAQTTSAILIGIATLLLAASVILVRAPQAWVLSTGLLLGGLFTMIYGAGWSVASGEGAARFWVLVLALAITAGLGYLRFVRGHEVAATTAVTPGVAGSDAELAPIEHRVAELERALDSLRDALGSSR